MATQVQTEEGVEREQPRQRRRAKDRPDALAYQLSKLSETDSSRQQNDTDSKSSKASPAIQEDDPNIDWYKEPDSTFKETAQAFARTDKAMLEYLAEACRKLDHEEFKLHAMAQTYDMPTVSMMANRIEEKLKPINAICLHGPKDHEAYLRNFKSVEEWEDAAAIFSQSMRYIERRDSEPYVTAMQFVDSLCASSSRHLVLIAELLPRLVELNQIDLQLQFVLRRRWTYIDIILDRWFTTERKERCDVPDWQEISQLFRSIPTKDEGDLPARLNHISSALWLGLLIFLVTVPTAALGWQYSPHQRGTTQDADFWFLIQSSCMTILGFATLAIPIWRTEAFSVKARYWVWGLLIAASLCMLLSPLVYIFGPTEWSQFMSIVAGIVQVFLTLQVALIADSVGRRASKSGKKDK